MFFGQAMKGNLIKDHRKQPQRDTAWSLSTMFWTG